MVPRGIPKSSRIDDSMPCSSGPQLRMDIHHPADGIHHRQPTRTAQSGHSQGHICFAPHTIGFLIRRHYEPDIVSQLLRRAGDIESNPGPIQTRRQRIASQASEQEREYRQSKTPSKRTKPSLKTNILPNTPAECTTLPTTPQPSPSKSYAKEIKFPCPFVLHSRH